MFEMRKNEQKVLPLLSKRPAGSKMPGLLFGERAKKEPRCKRAFCARPHRSLSIDLSVRRQAQV